MRAVVAAVVIALPGPAAAAVTVCLDVHSDQGDRAGFERLVRSELERHPSHAPVGDGHCDTHLRVSFFRVADRWYLTARVDRAVPMRYEMSSTKELGHRLTEALRRVLGSDPVHLARDVTRYNAVQRALHTILRRGRNRFRVELFQLLGAAGDVAQAAGGAFAFSRGSGHWRVLARLYGAGAAGSPSGKKLLLRLTTGAELGLTYELDARDDNTFYASGLVGAQLLRFEGRRVAGGDVDFATKYGATVAVRAGWRFFRTYDFNVDVFTAAYFPLFVTRDPDTDLIDRYTPSLQLGIGVAF